MLRKFTCSHMGFFGSLFLSILVSLHEVSQAIRSTSTIKEQLLKHGIMPDVMTFAPIKDIMVKYSDDAVANFGNKITTPKTQHEPYVQWSANPEHQYTLLMIDPDSPSRAHPADREWLHWLVVNINSFDVAHGDVLAEYIGPHPVQGSGYHRYVFIVLRQTTNQTIKFTEPYRSNTTMEGREKFSTRLFCDKYKYPNPWAVNFFHGEWFDAEQDKIDNDP